MAAQKKDTAKSRTKKAEAAAGDDPGVVELTETVARTLREHRKRLGMSLEDLAQASGVSRAALSQIETKKTNPTLGVLWKVATGLGIPFRDLLGTNDTSAQLLRWKDVRVIRSADGRFESRPILPPGSASRIEVYELRLAPRAAHASEPHLPGTEEFLHILAGQVRLLVGSDVWDLSAGDSIIFRADRAHSYQNLGAGEARCHNVIVYAR